MLEWHDVVVMAALQEAKFERFQCFELRSQSHYRLHFSLRSHAIFHHHSNLTADLEQEHDDDDDGSVETYEKFHLINAV